MAGNLVCSSTHQQLQMWWNLSHCERHVVSFRQQKGRVSCRTVWGYTPKWGPTSWDIIGAGVLQGTQNVTSMEEVRTAARWLHAKTKSRKLGVEWGLYYWTKDLAERLDSNTTHRMITLTNWRELAREFLPDIGEVIRYRRVLLFFFRFLLLRELLSDSVVIVICALL